MNLRRLLAIGFGFLAVLGVVVGAWAYWTTQGSGSASASVGTLDEATISVPSISAGSITLSWSQQASLSSNPSLNSGITYTVERKLGSGGAYVALSGGGCSGSLPYNVASCTDNVDTSGDYYYRVIAHYHSSWTATSEEAGPVNADTAPPTIQSIARHASSPTNASSVQFDISFSESVSGVGLDDFALATTGVSGASKSAISGSGASYTVTVDTGTGNGSVGLNLVDDDSIQDGAGNKLGGTGTSGAGDGSFTGEVYAVDKSAPDVSVTRVNGSAVAFPYSTNTASVTSIGGTCGSLSEDSTTVSVTINGSDSAPPMATCSSGSWTLTLTTPLSAEGSYTVAATQTDTAGNSGSSGNQAITIDRTTPTRTALEFFDTNGNGKVDQVKLTYSETLGSYTAGTSPWTLANVPSGGSLASVSVSGPVATLNITEGGGAPNTSVGSPAFTVAYTAPASGGIADPAGNKAASFVPTSPSDKAEPALTLLQMFDANMNGRIDQVKATFSETLATSTATGPWTLTSVPSNGSISSVSVAGAIATLTLTEGAGAADTSVGSFTVALSASSTGIRDAAGNQSSFAAQAPADKAGPVPASIADTDGASNGLFQQNDTMTVTFSENVTGVAASSTVTLIGGSGSANDSVSMTNLLASTASLGRTDYMGASNKNATFSASPLSRPAANQVSVTVATCSGDCSSIGSGAAGTGSFTFTPVSAITDAAGNAAAGSLSVTIRLF
jgi:Big-like domain-containing protein